MDYFEITFRLTGIPDDQRELFPYQIESLGFEGFNEIGSGLLAYIPSNLYDRDLLIETLRNQQIPEDCFSEARLPDKNWNEDWEKNFEPVVIDDRCLIRAPFHKPDSAYPLEIIIEPKMSFGTGHHATTSLMISEMLKIDLKNKSLFDAGCGTGILAILAEKLGANDITAIDIDEWSFRNATENINNNNCNRITVMLGDAATVTGKSFDVIVANINLNILKSGLQHYSKLLLSQGQLLMSGILVSDLEVIKIETSNCGLVFEDSNTLNNWALVRFKKI